MRTSALYLCTASHTGFDSRRCRRMCASVQTAASAERILCRRDLFWLTRLYPRAVKATAQTHTDTQFQEDTQMKRLISIAALSLSLAAISSASAADGYVTGNVSLRSGPSSSYPRVTMLSAGTSVAIEGCVDGWSWCDVATGEDRGWVAGNFLQEEYQGQRVLIPDYGLQIGIPIVAFEFSTYWDNNYRNRPWYGDRERWSQVRPQTGAVVGHAGTNRNSTERASADSHAPAANQSHAASASNYGKNGSAERSLPAQASQQGKPANTPAPQHPVATDFRSQEKVAGHEKPTGRSASESMATTQPNEGAAHKMAEPKPQRTETPAKSAPERDGGKDKDKDQH